MDKKSDTKSIKIGLPYWMALVIGIISSCALEIVFASILWNGILLPWKSMPKLPSKVVHIIHADPATLWVQTNDEHIFTISIDCHLSKCFQWFEVNNLSDVKPERYYSSAANLLIRRGVTCDGLGRVDPWIGKTTECVLAEASGPEVFFETYFALKSDGSIKYWSKDFRPVLAIICFSPVLPILVALIMTKRYQGTWAIWKNKK